MINSFPRAGVGQGPDPTALDRAVRAAVAGVLALSARVTDGAFIVDVEKGTAWQPAEVAAVQAAINGVPDSSPARSNQAIVDAWSVEKRALLLTILDQINVLRADLTSLGINRPPITPAQAIAAARTKAGQLT